MCETLVMNKPNTTEDASIIYHDVSSIDTLQGIMLRYGVSLNDLKKLNEFPNRNFRVLRRLVIKDDNRNSTNKEYKQQKMIRDFRIYTGECLIFMIKLHNLLVTETIPVVTFPHTHINFNSIFQMHL